MMADRPLRCGTNYVTLQECIFETVIYSRNQYPNFPCARQGAPRPRLNADVPGRGL